MASARNRNVINYVHLHNLSSDILFKTGKKPKGKLFLVDRIIERRKTAHLWEYLIKWTGLATLCKQREPSDHLTQALLQSYENPPKPDQGRIEQASRSFYEPITKSLKGKSTTPVYAQIDLDVQRWLWKGKGIPSEHKGHKLYEKEDFGKLILQDTWWYHLDSNGEGKAIDFAMKIKPVLLWIPKHYIFQNGKLKQAERLPVEKDNMHFARRACNVNTL